MNRCFWIFFGWSLGLVAVLAQPPGRTANPSATEDIYEKLLRSTAFIAVPMLDKKTADGIPLSTGTGSLISGNPRRLLLTNYHVVADYTEVFVMFPQRKANGDVIGEREKYLDHLTNPRVAAIAKVVAARKDKDLALLELDPRAVLPPGILPIRLAPRSARPASNVHYLG